MHDSNGSVAPERFAWYRSRAAILVRTPGELSSLSMRAARKIAGSSGVTFGLVREQLTAFIGLLKAYADGSYRGVSNRTLIAVAAAVLYFVMPLDLVPDFIFGLGLVDDAAVIGYVFNLVRGELDEFVAWQQRRSAEVE